MELHEGLLSTSPPRRVAAGLDEVTQLLRRLPEPDEACT